jgi:hypothetical protein
MSHDPDALSREEYRALRATIRERGTLRLAVIALTILGWATLLVFTRQWPGPGSAIALLLVLAAGFEVVFAAHVGVERVGRYIQRRYERPDDLHGPVWERTAMRLGQGGLARGPDPLGAWLFESAVLVNLLHGFTPADWPRRAPVVALALLLAHAALIWRILWARRFAAGQRERDLAAMTSTEPPSP